MRKKSAVYILILIWAVVIIQAAVNRGLGSENQIIEAFNVVEPVPVESDVEAQGCFGDMYLSVEKKEQMLKSMADSLSITSDYELSSSVGEGYEKSRLLKDGKMAKTDLQIISMHGVDEDGADSVKQYIYATIRIYENVDSILYYRRLLSELFENIGVEADINVYLEGEIEGAIADRRKDELAGQFLKAMHAKEVCRYTGDGLYIVYGYTNTETEYVTQDGERVNVNIAVTYDEEGDRTYIHMAVPYIAKSL